MENLFTRKFTTFEFLKFVSPAIISMIFIATYRPAPDLWPPVPTSLDGIPGSRGRTITIIAFFPLKYQRYFNAQSRQKGYKTWIFILIGGCRRKSPSVAQPGNGLQGSGRSF